MRAKTETRRQSILEVAAQVFCEMGFERASMNEICQRVGGSKATIYNYFPSKEELFFEVIFKSTEAEFLLTHDALDPQVPDVAQALERFGQGLLALLYSPNVQAVRRLVVSEGARSGLGRKCHELGPARSDAMVAGFLQQAMDQGKLRQADARVATAHLKALLESELLVGFLFQTREVPTPEEIAASTCRAVAVFMAAYGPQPEHIDPPLADPDQKRTV